MKKFEFTSKNETLAHFASKIVMKNNKKCYLIKKLIITQLFQTRKNR